MTLARFAGVLSACLSPLAAAQPLSVTPPAPAAPARPRDVAALLEPIRAKHDLPALAAVILSGDEVSAQGVAGVRKRGSPETATIDDLWHIGSCTKSMTATLCAVLVERGTLRWDMTIPEALPDITGMNPAWRTVTLEQLLTHRAGAPQDLNADGLWGRLWAHTGSPTEQRRTLAEGVLSRAPVHPPAGEYLYSNAGFALAGHMAETVTGRAWEDLMRDLVFAPLGMASAGFGAPGEKGAVSQPRGHSTAGAPIEPGKNADNPAAIGPGGTVHCSLPDWSKYIALHLRGGRDDGVPRLVTPASIEKLHAPAAAQDRHKYAMGWGVEHRAWGGRVITHNGSNTMWFAVTWLAPEKDFAVLVATNQGGDAAAKATDEAAWALIQDHLGRVEPASGG